MQLTNLPNDILLDIMDLLPCAYAMKVACHSLLSLWKSTHLQVTEDGNEIPVPAEGSSGSMVRWLRYSGERFSWCPAVDQRPRTIILQVNGWMERWNLCKLLLSCHSSLERLVMRSSATIQNTTLSAVCNVLSGLPHLQTLEVRFVHTHLADAACTDVANSIALMYKLSRLSLVLPMNSVTIMGLHRLISGVLQAPLRELIIDVSGNWIRGTEYGKELARLSQMTALRVLRLTFGGWGVRKQFGLEHLAMFSSLTNLRELALTIVGARVTCDFFKKAMSGVASLPGLESLHLDLIASDVGQQCHRGLSMLRACRSLQTLVLSLGCPSERLLAALGAIQYASNLRRAMIILDQRSQAFTENHAQQLVRFTPRRCCVQFQIQNATVSNMNTVFNILVLGFHSMRCMQVLFLDCHMSMGCMPVYPDPWHVYRLKEHHWLLRKACDADCGCCLAVPPDCCWFLGHV